MPGSTTIWQLSLRQCASETHGTTGEPLLEEEELALEELDAALDEEELEVVEPAPELLDPLEEALLLVEVPERVPDELEALMPPVPAMPPAPLLDDPLVVAPPVPVAPLLLVEPPAPVDPLLLVEPLPLVESLVVSPPALPHAEDPAARTLSRTANKDPFSFDITDSALLSTVDPRRLQAFARSDPGGIGLASAAREDGNLSTYSTRRSRVEARERAPDQEVTTQSQGRARRATTTPRRPARFVGGISDRLG